MGVRASSPITRSGGATTVKWSTTAKVIHTDGRLQEFSQPIKADHLLSLHPNTFLCSSETMYVNAQAPPVPGDEDLQPGQLYFLMPASKSQSPLSLHELCALAVIAGAALQRLNTPSFFDDNRVGSRRGQVNKKKMIGAVRSRLSSKQLR